MDVIYTRSGRDWTAKRAGTEGVGLTKVKALQDLKETERFIRIVRPRNKQ